MPDVIKQIGERLQIASSLEVVVLEMSSNRVKLGIRSLNDSPPSATCDSFDDGHSRFHYSYYHSEGGGPMLVVCAAPGQRLLINDLVDVSVVHCKPPKVHLYTAGRKSFLPMPYASQPPSGFAGITAAIHMSNE